MLQSSIEIAVPLILAALGEIFAERAGLLNMGIEGMILISCFITFFGVYYTGQVILAVLLSLLAGVLAGLFMGLFTMKLMANMSITGIVFNLLAGGLTGFFPRLLIGVSLVPVTIKKLAPLNLFHLKDLPYLGIVFRQSPLVYVTALLAPLSSFVLFRTNLGLSIRAVGGSAVAAETMGIPVLKIRYLCWCIACCFASLAGSYLVLNTGMFTEGMSANRGFIAIALVVFARWRPSLAVVGAFLFGITDAFQLRLQALNLNVPFQLLVILPYGMTIAVLLLAAKFKYVNPSVIGLPYVREDSKGA
jgi:simple sugar transport system permease protein